MTEMNKPKETHQIRSSNSVMLLSLLALALLIANSVVYFNLWSEKAEQQSIKIGLLHLRELKARIRIYQTRIDWVAQTVMPDLVLSAMSEAVGIDVDKPELRENASDVLQLKCLYMNQVANLVIPDGLSSMGTKGQRDEYQAGIVEIRLAQKEAQEFLDKMGGFFCSPESTGFGIYAPEECIDSDEAMAIYMKEFVDVCDKLHAQAKDKMDQKAGLAIKAQAAGGAKITVDNVHEICGVNAYEKEIDKIRFARLPPIRKWTSSRSYARYVQSLDDLSDLTVQICPESESMKDFKRAFFE